MQRWIMTIMAVLAAAGIGAAEFVSERRGYAVEIPDGWFRVAPETVAELKRNPAEAARLGVEPGYIAELEGIAADPGVDYFVLRFTDAYSDNMNVAAITGEPLPRVFDLEEGKTAFGQAYTAALGAPVEAVAMANLKFGQFPALMVEMKSEMLKLGILQYLVEIADGEILCFTMNAGLDGFEEAKGHLPGVLATLRRVEAAPAAEDDNEG